MDEDNPADAFEGDATRRGGNQVGLKQYNERLILSLIREAGALSKADIARITRLSSQTVTVIVNRLLVDGLLRKKDVIRGRIGQPSTPIELNPDGALSIGVKIGRRSLDLLALSIDRRVVAKKSFRYSGLDEDVLSNLMGTAFDSLKSELTDFQISRLVGLGIAAPTALEAGEPVIGDPDGVSPRWREADLVARAEETSGLSAVVLNDATAACLAEIDLRREKRQGSMVYFYIGTLIGGSIVLEGKLVAGRTGNAGAVGAVPLGLASASGGAKPGQVIEAASLIRLEDIAARRNLPMTAFHEDGGAIGMPDAAVVACFDEWCESAADALAFAAIAGTSFIEAESVVIDGVLRRPLLDHLIARVRERTAEYKLAGIVMPEFRAGAIGFDARALGAGLVPLNEQFTPDNKVMLKS